MRTTTFMLALLAATGSAHALEADATMKAWAAAPDADRTELMGRILGKHAGNLSEVLIRKCVDEASAIPGHADLEIKEVVLACKASKGGGQPV